MRWIVGISMGTIVVLATTTPVWGQAPTPGSPPVLSPGRAPAPPPNQLQSQATAPPTSDPQLDTILARWEEESAKVETFGVAFEQEDVLEIVGGRVKYKGLAYLQRPNLVALRLDKEVEPGNYAFDRQILSTGDEVVEIDNASEQITVYPLPKDAQQRAMEEGPLPFLFRMNVEEFKRRYRAELHPSKQPDAYRIAIYPLQKIDREAFTVAVLYLDKQTLMPKSIHTLSPNGKDKQHYIIKKIRRNVEIKPGTFTWNAQREQELQRKGWRIIHNPLPGEPGPAAQPAPRVGQGADSPPRPR